MNDDVSLLFLGEYTFYILEDIENNLEKTTANILDQVFLSSDFQIIVVNLNNAFSEPYDPELEYTNINEAITKIEIFDDNLDFPSGEEIQNIKIKDSCLKSFKEAEEWETHGLAKSSIFQRILFINKQSNICEELENSQIKNALKLQESIRFEENPFLSIDKKLYLSLFVKCNDDLFRVECIEGYLGPIKEEITALLIND